jgi:hypothetical protein
MTVAALKTMPFTSCDPWPKLGCVPGGLRLIDGRELDVHATARGAVEIWGGIDVHAEER